MCVSVENKPWNVIWVLLAPIRRSGRKRASERCHGPTFSWMTSKQEDEEKEGGIGEGGRSNDLTRHRLPVLRLSVQTWKRLRQPTNCDYDSSLNSPHDGSKRALSWNGFIHFNFFQFATSHAAICHIDKCRRWNTNNARRRRRAAAMRHSSDNPTF